MRTVALGELVDFYSGGTPSKSERTYWEGPIPWFSAKDMKQATLTQSVDHLSEMAFTSTSLRKLPAGTVVMVVRGMILAHTIPIGMLAVEAAINQDLKALLPGNELEPAYLAAMLRAQHETILGQVSTAAHGTKKLESRVLEKIQIPLPVIEEQRRIAVILDRADALRVKRRETLALLDELTQSIFLDMFGGVVPKGRGPLRVVTLGDVADVSSGITKGRRLTPGTATRDVPYLAVVNVQDRRLNLSSVKTIAASAAEIARYRLQVNDLLLTEGGDPDKLGRGTLWSGELPETIHQNHVFRVRVHDRSVRPLYLNWLVGSEHGRRYFLRSAKQTTGIASINMSQLRAFPVPIPERSAQIEFERRLDQSSRVRQHLERQQSASTDLFSSLQQRALTGEL